MAVAESSAIGPAAICFSPAGFSSAGFSFFAPGRSKRISAALRPLCRTQIIRTRSPTFSAAAFSASRSGTAHVRIASPTVFSTETALALTRTT